MIDIWPYLLDDMLSFYMPVVYQQLYLQPDGSAKALHAAQSSSKEASNPSQDLQQTRPPLNTASEEPCNRETQVLGCLRRIKAIINTPASLEVAQPCISAKELYGHATNSLLHNLVSLQALLKGLQSCTLDIQVVNPQTCKSFGLLFPCL